MHDREPCDLVIASGDLPDIVGGVRSGTMSTGSDRKARSCLSTT